MARVKGAKIKGSKLNASTGYVNNEKFVTMLSAYTGCTKQMLYMILKSEGELIESLLEKGYEVKISGLGSFYLGYRKAKAGRKFKHPITGEISMLDAKPPYLIPEFKYRDVLVDSIRKNSEAEYLDKDGKFDYEKYLEDSGESDGK